MRLVRIVPSMLLVAIVALAPSPAHAVVRHVTTTGSAAGDGSIASPYDLATALAATTPGDSVYIAHGSYTWTESVNGPLPIQDDCLIEGDFDPVVWTKAPGTSITIAPDLHDFSGQSGYYAGIDASGRSGFVVRDLALSVLPAGASGTYAHKGISVYGVHLAGCSNYSFAHVAILTGPASNGDDGEAGLDGTGGVHGTDGGSYDASVCGFGGFGGTGGGQGTVTIGPSTCNASGTIGNPGSGREGGNGGAGGAGGNRQRINTRGGGGGRGGYTGNLVVLGGAGGVGGAWACGPNPGGNGVAGKPGIDGTGFAPDVRNPIDAAQRSTWFITAGAASSGTAATGGSGGGGGGGGGATGLTDGNCDITPYYGAGGGGGGGGGEGGTGGTGGFGGGSAYAVYVVSNGANTAFTCMVLTPGGAGLGGAGGASGAGGAPGAGGIGGLGPYDIGHGGAGGAGGAGGGGGRGQDGQNGESVAWVVASGTAPAVTESRDYDGDTWPDVCDNCPSFANFDQLDSDHDTVGDACEGLAADDGPAPLAFALHAGRPNPTASFTRIAYDVPRAANVTLRVYDAQGRAVRLLASGADSPGRKTARWDLADDRGVRVRAGIYFIRLSADRFEAQQRVIVLD